MYNKQALFCIISFYNPYPSKERKNLTETSAVEYYTMKPYRLYTIYLQQNIQAPNTYRVSNARYIQNLLKDIQILYTEKLKYKQN